MNTWWGVEGSLHPLTEVLIDFVTTVDLPCKYSNSSTSNPHHIMSQADNVVRSIVKGNQSLHMPYHYYKLVQLKHRCGQMGDGNNWFGVAKCQREYKYPLLYMLDTHVYCSWPSVVLVNHKMSSIWQSNYVLHTSSPTRNEAIQYP